MAYFNNRKTQIINTLNSIKDNYYPFYSFEVIIIDDNSSSEFKLYDVIKNYPYTIKYIEISSDQKKDRVNPCSAYNKGFNEASGDVIIIQNPECYHVGDIILYLINNLKETDYISFSCYNTNSDDLTNELISSSNKHEKILESDFISRNSTEIYWYNHPEYRPCGYHFCSAIYKSKLNILGGFDENFADGYCYDDDEFLLRIKYQSLLNVIIPSPNDIFVIHQYHKRNDSTNILDANDDNIIKIKFLRNKKLFEDKLEYYKNK